MNYRVNLLPLELQPRSLLEPRRLAFFSLLVMVAGGLVFALFSWCFAFYQMRFELSALQQQLPRLRQTVARMEEIRKERRELEAAVSELETLIHQRHTWSKMLEDLNKVIPREIWLTSLHLATSQPASGSGQAASSSAGASAQRPSTVPSLLQGGMQEVRQIKEDLASTQSRQTAGQVQEGGKNAIPPPPDSLTLEGASTSLAAVGVLTYQLGQLPYFSEINLNEVKYDEAKGVYTFKITARLKGDGS